MLNRSSDNVCHCVHLALLGIKKKYEPLLLVPIAFGVLLANFPGGEMGVIQADENGMVMVNGVMKNIWEMPLHEIAHDLGLMNFIYYMLIKTGFFRLSFLWGWCSDRLWSDAA